MVQCSLGKDSRHDANNKLARMDMVGGARGGTVTEDMENKE